MKSDVNSRFFIDVLYLAEESSFYGYFAKDFFKKLTYIVLFISRVQICDSSVLHNSQCSPFCYGFLSEMVVGFCEKLFFGVSLDLWGFLVLVSYCGTLHLNYPWNLKLVFKSWDWTYLPLMWRLLDSTFWILYLCLWGFGV